MTYLLDTNAWLRLFTAPDEINAKVRKALAVEAKLAVSPFSLIEICQKSSTGKLTLSFPLKKWLEAALPPHLIELLPVTPEIAHRAYTLKLTDPKTKKPHRDPADLIISATALSHKLTLVTSDKILLHSRKVRTLSTR